jgi:hypothetical protein
LELNLAHNDARVPDRAQDRLMPPQRSGSPDERRH